MHATSDLFAAVADPTRLAVLALLQRHGECCVCDIHGILELSPSRASRALKGLRLAGLLADRRVGTWIHYRVAPRPGWAQAALLDAVAAMFPAADAAALDERVRAYRIRAASNCAAPPPAPPGAAAAPPDALAGGVHP
jgi:ArsR family transcriptional regulator